VRTHSSGSTILGGALTSIPNLIWRGHVQQLVGRCASWLYPHLKQRIHITSPAASTVTMKVETVHSLQTARRHIRALFLVITLRT
jgi:hypothetical protein